MRQQKCINRSLCLMLSLLNSKFLVFFSRNLFDRLVIYIFLSELAVKVVFELLLGQWWYETVPYKQYIFYTLMLLDYVICLPRIARIEIKTNYMSMFLLLFLFVIVQGIFVGLMRHNHSFEIFNDSLPLVFLVLNALRMQSLSERPNQIDFSFLLKFSTILGLAICLTGYAAVSLGLPAISSLGGLPGGIYFPLIFSAIIAGARPSLPTLIAFTIILTLTISNMNRTTLIFILCITGYITYLNFRKSPVYGITLCLAVCFAFSMVWFTLPKESGIHTRIIGLTELNFSATKGSVGERGQEFRAINQKLDYEGEIFKWVGLGHGALYEVSLTHEFKKDYGHAHYSWAMFKLRYGYLGYIYLFLMAMVLMINAYKNWNRYVPSSLLISLICVQCLLYLGTYVNFVFLLSGLPFFYFASPTQTVAPRNSVVKQLHGSNEKLDDSQPSKA